MLMWNLYKRDIASSVDKLFGSTVSTNRYQRTAVRAVK